MASQMIAVQVLIESAPVEEKFFTKVTPWMRQDFGALVTCRVSMLNMTPQLLHVVDSLLTHKHSTALEANQAEGFLMCCLHVATQTFLVRERFLCGALIYKAGQCTQFHSFNLRRQIMVKNRLVLFVLIAVVADLLIEGAPSECLILSNDDFFELLLAKSAFLVI